MTANKMPKPRTALEEQCVAYGTACFDAGYLAGIEAAKACVPAQSHFGNKIWNDCWLNGMEDCRATTLTNLTALEQEAKK